MDATVSTSEAHGDGTAVRAADGPTTSYAYDQAHRWRQGEPEPASPQVTATDTTPALQAPGSVGLATYLSALAGTTAPIHARYDNLTVTEPTGPGTSTTH